MGGVNIGIIAENQEKVHSNDPEFTKYMRFLDRMVLTSKGKLGNIKNLFKVIYQYSNLLNKKGFLQNMSESAF